MYPDNELEILLSDDLTIKEVAEKLGITSNQVSYRKKMLRKEGVCVPLKIKRYSGTADGSGLSFCWR